MERHEIAMIGAVLAALTHDLRNVLGAIGESADLCRDLLEVAAAKEDPGAERLHGALQRVRRQTDRGGGLVGRLNTFAHLMDEERQQVVVATVLEQTIFLMGRSARMKEVDLESVSSHGEVAIEVATTRLILTLCAAVRALLGAARAGARLTLDAAPEGEEIVFLVELDHPDHPVDPAPWDALESWRGTVTALGGRIERRDGAGFVLRLPSRVL